MWGAKLMEYVDPRCPKCGGDMAFFSSDVSSEHYVCSRCNKFLTVPRPAKFFRKNPFKPDIY